jgi:integrase
MRDTLFICGGDVDLYNRELNLSRALEKLDAAEMPEENKAAIKAFDQHLREREYSAGRRQKYAEYLRKLALWLGKPFSEADRKDVARIVETIGGQGYAEWTKHDYKIILKVFYKWLRTGDIENTEYPEEVRWIKPSREKPSSKKLPSELLTEEEVQRMAVACTNSRDRAFTLVLYEFGGRIGEILTLRLRHVTFDQYGAVLIVDGKTGMRRARIIASAPALARWVEDHPQKDNLEAPLWIGLWIRGHGKRASYAAMRSMLKRAARNAKPPIRKRVHPHLFRHSRATALANIMTERQMESYLGWVPGSKMPSIYVHLSGKEVDPVLLRSQGIEAQEQCPETSFKPRQCVRCGEKNSPSIKFCNRCGAPLNIETALEIEEARSQADIIMDMLFRDAGFKEFLRRKLRELSSSKLSYASQPSPTYLAPEPSRAEAPRGFSSPFSTGFC